MNNDDPLYRIIKYILDDKKYLVENLLQDAHDKLSDTSSKKRYYVNEIVSDCCNLIDTHADLSKGSKVILRSIIKGILFNKKWLNLKLKNYKIELI